MSYFQRNEFAESGKHHTSSGKLLYLRCYWIKWDAGVSFPTDNVGTIHELSAGGHRDPPLQCRVIQYLRPYCRPFRWSLPFQGRSQQELCRLPREGRSQPTKDYRTCLTFWRTNVKISLYFIKSTGGYDKYEEASYWILIMFLYFPFRMWQFLVQHYWFTIRFLEWYGKGHNQSS